jgi:hypothetical protein
VFVLCLTISAQSHHRLHFGTRTFAGYQSGGGIGRHKNAAESRVSAGSGPLGSLMGKLIGECSLQLAELDKLPMESIGRMIHADDAQLDTIQTVRRTAQDTANALAAACPTQAPASPPTRLAAARRAIEVVEMATSTLREPLETFYQSLRDEQKTRLAAGILVVEADATGAVPLLAGTSTDSGDSREARVAERVWDCGIWIADLRGWPIMKAEQSLQLTARQLGAFYELAAAFQFAADSLEDSCPNGTQPTPIRRLTSMTEKLEALRASTDIIRAPLTRFYEVLDDGQRARFSAGI